MAKKKFEVLNTPHMTQDRKVHEPGAVIESEENLMVLFPNKFKLREERHYQSPKPAPVEQPEEEKLTGEDRVEGIQDDWQDVTQEKFPAASGQGVTVLEKKGKFNLYYGDDRQHALNDKPMSKKEAVKFIEEIEPAK